jgi:hypothetical protein
LGEGEIRHTQCGVLDDMSPTIRDTDEMRQQDQTMANKNGKKTVETIIHEKARRKNIPKAEFYSFLARGRQEHEVLGWRHR